MFIDFIKSVYYEILSYFAVEKVKYEVQGNCKKCGKCCKQIHSYGMKNEKDLKIMQFFLPHYKRFYINGKDENGNITLSCIYLKDNGECSIYEKRPRLCRNYPARIINFNGEMIQECGYKVVKKEFKDYL